MKNTNIPYTNLFEPLSVDDFERFYKALHGYRPFRWQSRMASRVCSGDWPDCIKLPTASGKTAAIDIAIFALAFQAAEVNRPDGVMTSARRIFFVVDRRIVVNEAFRQAKRTAKRLRTVIDSKAAKDNQLETADSDILVRVARWLQYLAGDDTAPPLDCFELRGGIYRDDAWVRSPLQPTVLASTIDQVGSRMLFRGYGVTDRNLSIHAGLTANDSLIILDEAHCSKPFSQTMESIARYRSDRWAEQSIKTPFSFVQMTATPPPEIPQENLFELTEADYQNDTALEQRHGCRKEVRLELANGAKGKKLSPILARKLADQAMSLSEENGLQKIAVVVNRVSLAREVFEFLKNKHGERVFLMIGRMRPIDRDELTEQLHAQFAANPSQASKEQPIPDGESEPRFVVATQCLEVGADLDFDGMVSQCASLDALRQRFGRLNRLGDSPDACGVIIAADGDLQPIDKLSDDKPLDPIYGNALARTWYWLKGQADDLQSGDHTRSVINFGIKALEARCESLGEKLVELLAPALDAPVLMPAHVDMLCQTSPRPSPEPDVSAYLHGPNRDSPEVRVCWRADLSTSRVLDRQNSWLSAVEVCPPSTAECLAVPLNYFREWLRGQNGADDTSDVLGEQIDSATEVEESDRATRTVLVWRGKRTKDEERSFCVNGVTAGQLRPNDTIVIPAELGGWNTFGYIPNAPTEPAEIDGGSRTSTNGQQTPTGETASSVNDFVRIDVADRAFLQSCSRTILRVHPNLRPDDEIAELFHRLLIAASDPESDLGLANWQDIAKSLHTEAGETLDLAVQTTDLENSRLQRLISSNGQIVRYHAGLAWITQRHEELRQGILPLPSFGDDRDSLSLTGKVALKQHLADVSFETERLVSVLSVQDPLNSSLTTAARTHDVGKADPRFQAMLLNKPLSVAYMQPQFWAKSDGTQRNTPSELPDHFRHEMLSLELLKYFEIDKTVDSELVNHLVSSHHGYARPFAPVCSDNSPPGLNLRSFGLGDIKSENRASWTPPHRLDSGIADRFWSMNRGYGWWGLAYLESLLRMADWRASAVPGTGDPQKVVFSKPSDQASARLTRVGSESVVLTGLDGSNPLAFLAALGIFRSISTTSPDAVFQMAWANHQGAWRPVIFSKNECNLTQESILDLLEALSIQPHEHPALRLAEDADKRGIRAAFLRSAYEANPCNRSDADWLTCNGSDVVGSENISQLQTTRRDYHAINIEGLITLTSRDHFRRSLFESWDYSDPIAGVSLHLEPREDRRHAYQWHMPSGDPTRKTFGGMMGANRLALEAWPLFQSLPYNDKLTTVGFCGTKANNTRFTWPIWSSPVSLAVLSTILSLHELQQSRISEMWLKLIGIEVVFQCRRILVGKTPNLTSPVAIFS